MLFNLVQIVFSCVSGFCFYDSILLSLALALASLISVWFCWLVALGSVFLLVSLLLHACECQCVCVWKILRLLFFLLPENNKQSTRKYMKRIQMDVWLLFWPNIFISIVMGLMVLFIPFFAAIELLFNVLGEWMCGRYTASTYIIKMNLMNHHCDPQSRLTFMLYNQLKMKLKYMLYLLSNFYIKRTERACVCVIIWRKINFDRTLSKLKTKKKRKSRPFRLNFGYVSSWFWR